MCVTFTAAVVISNRSTGAPITLEKVNVTGEGFRVGLRNRGAIQPVITLFRVYPAIEKVQTSQTLSSLLTVCAMEVGSKVNEYTPPAKRIRLDSYLAKIAFF
jgi:hypothetical protein